jgi:hypothetical protein
MGNNVAGDTVICAVTKLNVGDCVGTSDGCAVGEFDDGTVANVVVFDDGCAIDGLDDGCAIDGLDDGCAIVVVGRNEGAAIAVVGRNEGVAVVVVGLNEGVAVVVVGLNEGVAVVVGAHVDDAEMRRRRTKMLVRALPMPSP